MWIIKNSDKADKKIAVFYKRFIINEKITECVLKISALGIFRIKINNHEIDEYFMPGWTNYDKYVNLCRYDITKYIRKDNLIEITVADGWYSGRLGYNMSPGVYGKTNALYAEITAEGKEG